jgi:hypothetical protein
VIGGDRRTRPEFVHAMREMATDRVLYERATQRGGGPGERAAVPVGEHRAAFSTNEVEVATF